MQVTTADGAVLASFPTGTPRMVSASTPVAAQCSAWYHCISLLKTVYHFIKHLSTENRVARSTRLWALPFYKPSLSYWLSPSWVKWPQKGYLHSSCLKLVFCKEVIRYLLHKSTREWVICVCSVCNKADCTQQMLSNVNSHCDCKRLCKS